MRASVSEEMELQPKSKNYGNSNSDAREKTTLTSAPKINISLVDAAPTAKFMIPLEHKNFAFVSSAMTFQHMHHACLTHHQLTCQSPKRVSQFMAVFDKLRPTC